MPATSALLTGVEILGPPHEAQARVLTPEALGFLVELHRRFDPRRLELLERRRLRQRALDAGERPAFLEETRHVREGDWVVAPVPPDLQDRRVEITGPTDRKMMINALNSGARCFMADFEDANCPTWRNMIEGQANLLDAVEGTLAFPNEEGKTYTLREKTATLLVRPRGWHLPERHLRIDGKEASASLVDFGLAFFHNAKRLLAKGSGPYYYLPKLESHLEARLWNDVFVFVQERLGLPVGTIKATVLIETLPAAFEMDEILHELRQHSAGLNAGRWDYLFSVIKTFRHRPGFVLPERARLTMTVPFMRAYTELLVQTCHKRDAHAMGGMAAFVPSRRDPAVNAHALAKVREDKVREAADGFDGTWVAHPDLVPVATEVFDGVLGAHPNQVARKRPDVQVRAGDLLDFDVPDASITDAGLRTNVEVALQYLGSWLGGQGAVAIHHLMEDAATAEISRSQVWQWVHREATTAEGTPITRETVRRILREEHERLARILPRSTRLDEARSLFEEVGLSEELPEFLTLPAYARLSD